MIVDEIPFPSDKLERSVSRQLFFALMPLTLGLVASAVLGYFAPQLSRILLGNDSGTIGGYLMTSIVVLPFILASAYAEWALTRARQKDPDAVSER
jgi:hypothetical protein